MVIHRQGVPNRATHYRALAAEVERLWRETTDAPLKIVGSYDNLVYGTVFYFADAALDVRDRHAAPVALDRRRPPRPRRHRALLPGRRGALPGRDAARLAGRPPARREERDDFTRRYLGVADAPDRFVIAIVPPAR